VLIHLVARAERGRPFTDPTVAGQLWRSLRASFPGALAACLMPDHVHLLTRARDAASERRRLSHLLGAFTRVRHTRNGFRTADPVEIPNVAHLRRQARYVHLNPSRDRLADDPLAYPWSTHRGVIGAEVDPWVTAERLAQALEYSPVGFAERFHAYVSGDPSVLPEGTPFPRKAAARVVPAIPLETIRLAVEAAAPWSSAGEKARLTVLLARHQGWRDTATIAKAAGISTRTVQRHQRQLADVERLLGPAALCLGDERLSRAHARRWRG
jgi:hypothetical protein